ncbi:hypothetical protein B0H13DRAFT_1911780 [Mycena leptocephala]|nr:hypothetical protein B0H13DRAFT_1911780 [Mycena leptocephala]
MEDNNRRSSGWTCMRHFHTGRVSVKRGDCLGSREWAGEGDGGAAYGERKERGSGREKGVDGRARSREREKGWGGQQQRGKERGEEESGDASGGHGDEAGRKGRRKEETRLTLGKELHVHFTPPQIGVTDLKVGPDCAWESGSPMSTAGPRDFGGAGRRFVLGESPSMSGGIRPYQKKCQKASSSVCGGIAAANDRRVESRIGNRVSFSLHTAHLPPVMASQRPSLAHDNNTCPYCWTHLPIRLCKNGENRNKRYLLVLSEIKLRFNSHRTLLFYAKSSLLPPLPQDRYVHMPSAPPPLLLPSYAQSLPQQTVPTSLCRHPGCSSSRVAVQCKSHRCKAHCIILNQGDCPVKKHHPSMMSQRQRRNANISAPLFRPRSPSPPSDFDASMLDNVTFPAAFSSSSPAAIPSPSLRNSPELDEHEAHELELAMALSLASTLPPSTASTSTQLNPSWMSQATGTRPVNNTFNISQPSGRKAAVDLSTIHRSTLVYWDQDDKDPLITGVTECGPSWPNFRLSDTPQTLALLGDNLTAVEFYDVRFRLWIRVGLEYTHVLTSNTYLLLRRVGVSGRDQERLIDQFINVPGPQHIRYNLPAEREAVRAKLKARRHKELQPGILLEALRLFISRHIFYLASLEPYGPKTHKKATW